MFSINNKFDSSSYYDSLAKDYQGVYSQKKSYHDAIDELILKNKDYSSWKIVLDVGSGDGKRIIRLFPNDNCTLHSVENSSEMVKLLKHSSRIKRVINKDFCTLGPSDFDTEFDAVFMQWNVLGHLTNISDAFKLISHAVRVNGHFIFDFNNPFNYKHYGSVNVVKNFLRLNFSKTNRSLKFKIKHGESITETKFYSVTEVSRLLRIHGFKIISLVYLDYETGEFESRNRGQVFIDAIKI